MATLTLLPPLVGGGDMATDISGAIPVATAGVDGFLSGTDWNTFNNKLMPGTTLGWYGITDAQPLNSNLTDFGTAVPGVSKFYGTDAAGLRGFFDLPIVEPPPELGYVPENVANKVTGFATPTDTQYPSALLVNTALTTKLDKPVAISPGTKTKITYDANGLVTGGADATTADIAEVVDKRYLTDAQQEALGGLSGVNTGDQDLSGLATSEELAATNASLDTTSASLVNYALADALGSTNTTVAAISDTIPTLATKDDLATTNADVDTLTDNVVSNFTPLTTHASLETNFNTLSANIANPAFVPSTAFDAKLTFGAGLTRSGNVITADNATVVRPAHTFLGNNGDVDGVPAYVRPVANDLGNGLTGSGKVVLDINPIIQVPTANLTDAGVSTAPSVLIVQHDFSGGGSIVPGFGATIEFRGRSTTTSGRTMGAIRTVWVDPTDGSRLSNLVFSPVRASLATDALWLHGDGSMALGTNNGSGLGVLYAAGGFQAPGVGVAGQVLRDDGVSFKATRLDVGDLLGQFSGCNTIRSSTVDQTVATETIHLSVPITIINPLAIGTTWRITAWGNMDNGTTAITFTAALRWGGLTGVVLLSVPIVSTTTAGTNRSWRVEFLVMLSSSGVSGTARTCVFAHDHTKDAAGALTINEADSGATDVTGINANVTTTMVLTWAMSSTTGAPHVRTLCAFAELVRRSPDAPTIIS